MKWKKFFENFLNDAVLNKKKINQGEI